MSRTDQKQIKFSKGEINPYLNERTDIDLLDNSASYIRNYIPTVFGGLKTRFGTETIYKFNFVNNIYNINNLIDIKKIITIDNLNIDKCNFFNINNIKLSKYIEPDIQYNFTTDIVQPNLKRLSSITILTQGTEIDTRTTKPYITYTTDKQDLTNVIFDVIIDETNNKLLRIDFIGDFYYENDYSINLIYDKYPETNIKLYINNNLYNTYLFNLNETLNIKGNAFILSTLTVY